MPSGSCWKLEVVEFPVGADWVMPELLEAEIPAVVNQVIDLPGLERTLAVQLYTLWFDSDWLKSQWSGTRPYWNYR